MPFLNANTHAACRNFTPMLVKLYQTLKARPGVEDFEVVYCSLDKTDQQYQQYCAEMPWWCLSRDCPKNVLGRLANAFGASNGIPHLVILDKDGQTILVPDGVGNVSTDPDGDEFPWRPPPLVDLLPSYYLNSDKKRCPMSDLDDKYLMLYFRLVAAERASERANEPSVLRRLFY